jgi:hypothetical protein
MICDTRVELGPDRGFGCALIGAGGKLERQRTGRLAINERRRRIGLGTHLDLHHVAQPHLRAVLVDLQQNIFELLRLLGAAPTDDRGIEPLVVARRQAAQLARGDLHILRRDRAHH